MRRVTIPDRPSSTGLDIERKALEGLNVELVLAAASDQATLAHALRKRKHAIVTPHMAYHSEQAQRELQRRVAEEVFRTLRGCPPSSPVGAQAA
jgi:phosphoglycerate dehydrogenase-like enzyme